MIRSHYWCLVLFIVFVMVLTVGTTCKSQPYTMGGIHRCKRTVFVRDNLTGKVRKLIQYEEHNGIPGTGTWGMWLEDYCQKPYAKTWVFKTAEWPRVISKNEVKRLLGNDLFDFFEEHKEARISCYYNFTKVKGYVDSGVCKEIKLITIRK